MTQQTASLNIPTLAAEILGAAGIDAIRVRELDLDAYDADPLLEELGR